MNSYIVRCILALAFAALSPCENILAVTPGTTFTAIGDAPNFRAFGVSPNGQYVVGWRDQDPERQAFRWDEVNGLTLLGDLPGGRVWSQAAAVANNGLVVGTGEVIGGTNPFRWDPINLMVSLGTLGGSQVQGFANGVSADGSIVVGMSKDTSNRQVAYRWTQSGGMVPLGLFGSSQSSQADGISDDGTVIVGEGSSATEGWYWTTANGFHGVGKFGQSEVSLARAASADGSFIVGEASLPNVGNRMAFVWNGPGTITSLGDLANQTTASVAYDVSADGRIIVGKASTATAVLWERVNGNYQIYDLKQYLQDRYGLVLDGWQLQQASSLSADGRTIVGYGSSPNGGGIRAWRITLPVPEPSYLVLLGSLSLASMMFLCRRRKSASGCWMPDMCMISSTADPTAARWPRHHDPHSAAKSRTLIV